MKPTKIAIIGSGGHTRSLADLILTKFSLSDLSIYDNSFVYESDAEIEKIHSIPVIGNIKDIKPDQKIILSIGDNSIRKKYFIQLEDQIISDTLIHNNSIVGSNVLLGRSNQIFSSAFIASYSNIGSNNIINTGCIIEHESKIGDHNHISIGSVISGRCKIGSNCFVGASSVIIDNISICDDVIIGAGSVVVNNIDQAGTYVGNPVRKIK